MAFAKPLNSNEKRVIRILHHPLPVRRYQPLSYRDIAEVINMFFLNYNGGSRKGRGIYGYLKRKRNDHD